MKYTTKYLSLVISLIGLLCSSCKEEVEWNKKVESALSEVIFENVIWAMNQQPSTLTDFVCERSAGSIHDFYSEGDYWWPNPEDSQGAYIRMDGQTNPENFAEHRLAMIRLSKIVGSLASAYIQTGDERYVKHAFKHINAWFVDEKTLMNPNLLYAQAIKGVTTGRGIGIIDTIHLMEVAQGILKMQNAPCVKKENLEIIKKWFSDYIHWLTTHPYGIDEMNAKNNHGTCWVMQVSSFAKLVNDKETLDFCRLRYQKVLLPQQMAEDGSFPLEIERTKPYGYSLFNLDAMATICQILSDEDNNLWKYTTPNGVNIRKGIEYLYPFVLEKSLWPYPHDVMYWDDWPIAQPFLIFGAIAYNNINYFNLWEKLDHNPAINEVERNLPIRNPLIWL